MSQNPKNINLKSGGGRVSKVDEDAHKLISNLQKEIAFEKSKLPFFWDLSKSIKHYEGNLLKFYNFILKHHKISTSQLFQDLFVLFILNQKSNGTFLEFGATNGVGLSNSFMLEKEFGWTGVLAEPSPQWHTKLFENRPNATILLGFTRNGKKINFFVSIRSIVNNRRI